MKNIWTRYLEPISVEEAERVPFLQQLQKFEKHSHFNMQGLPVAELVEEPFEIIPDISRDTTGESAGRVGTVEVVDDPSPELLPDLSPELAPDSVPELLPDSSPELLPDPVPELLPDSSPGLAPDSSPELLPDSSPELAPDSVPELLPESSLGIQPMEVEDEIPQSLELEVPAIMEEVTTAVESESSELLDEVIGEVSGDTVVKYVGEGTEVMCWLAKSHKGHNMRLNTYPDDVVRLIEYSAGELLLKYSVSGEDIEDIPLASVEEAEDIINEDNAMTEDLYMDAPELKWVKVTEYEGQ